ALLADGDVDAAHLLVGIAGGPVLLLVQDRVDPDRGLAGLAVADDQLALAAADRGHRVDGLQSGLHRLLDRLALHDARRLQVEGAAADGLAGAEAVDGGAGGGVHAAVVAHPGREREHLAGAADLLALLDAGELAEDDDADLAQLEVQGEAEGAVLEADELVGHDVRQALDARDAVGGLADAADLRARGGAWVVGGQRGVQGAPAGRRAHREVGHPVLRFLSVSPCRASTEQCWDAAAPRAAAGWSQATSCDRARESRASTVASKRSSPTWIWSPPTTVGSTVRFSWISR